MSRKEFPKLFKYTTTGKIQEWSIIAENDTFYTIEGIVDGKLTTSLPTVCTGKNIGKKNETSPEQQALAEAQAKWQKKIDKGYNEVLSADKKFFEPMLAQDFKKSKDVDFKVKVFVQPKLDGLRAVNQNNTLMSRNGKPYLACPHLLQNNTLLDGELYSHDLNEDFNKIVSLCKKQDPNQDELVEARDKVQYWIYDFPSYEGVFSHRHLALKDWVSKNPNPAYVVVPTFQVRSAEEIKTRHEQFLAEGYEGTIVRLDLGDYENKRSKQLLKYKDFVDEEFKIVGVEEGTGGRTGTVGFFILQHDTNPDLTFKSNIKGDFTYLRDIWKNKESYIGKTATVKYFNRTPKQSDGSGNVPRFPYVVKINRESYE